MTSALIFLTVPIGNLSDITQRVKIALTEGKKFVVEDSRVFQSLLNVLGITIEGKEWLVWFDHSEPATLKKLKNWMKNGETVYIVSDAGSPVLSDPAYGLLQELKDQDFTLDSYGGVTSVIQALELSQLPPIPFHFHGFLARKKTDWRKQWFDCSQMLGTHIFFLSTHRVHETLDDLVTLGENINFCLARELTKKFQEVLHFKGDQWTQIKKSLIDKGEFVLLFSITKSSGSSDQIKLKELAQNYLQEQKKKNLAKLLALLLEEDTSDIYQKLE